MEYHGGNHLLIYNYIVMKVNKQTFHKNCTIQSVFHPIIERFGIAPLFPLVCCLSSKAVRVSMPVWSIWPLWFPKVCLVGPTQIQTWYMRVPISKSIWTLTPLPLYLLYQPCIWCLSPVSVAHLQLSSHCKTCENDWQFLFAVYSRHNWNGSLMCAFFLPDNQPWFSACKSLLSNLALKSWRCALSPNEWYDESNIKWKVAILDSNFFFGHWYIFYTLRNCP